MGEEYKKYDSQATFIIHNARLAKDPQVIEGGERPMVKLTFVVTSRKDRYSDMWVEATVVDRQASLASYLQKGDVVGFEGFPCLRKWGENNEKASYELDYAEVMPPPELFAALKERGFEAGAEVKGSGKKGGKKGGKPVAAPAAKKTRAIKEPEPEEDTDLDTDLDAEDA